MNPSIHMHIFSTLGINNHIRHKKPAGLDRLYVTFVIYVCVCIYYTCICCHLCIEHHSYNILITKYMNILIFHIPPFLIVFYGTWFLACAEQDRQGYTNICGQHHIVAEHLIKSLFLHPPVYTE